MTIEELQAETIKLKEEKELLESEYNSLKTIDEQNVSKITELEKDISTLKEHNMRLYLKVTQPVENQINTLQNENNKKEQQGEPKVNIKDVINGLK